MKISEITASQRAALTERVTVILSDPSKRSLELIATVKGRTISEVAREIIDGFLANNQDELRQLDDKTA